MSRAGHPKPKPEVRTPSLGSDGGIRVDFRPRFNSEKGAPFLRVSLVFRRCRPLVTGRQTQCHMARKYMPSKRKPAVALLEELGSMSASQQRRRARCLRRQSHETFRTLCRHSAKKRDKANAEFLSREACNQQASRASGLPRLRCRVRRVRPESRTRAQGA